MNELIKKVSEATPTKKTHNDEPPKKFQYKAEKKRTGPGFGYYLQKACERVEQEEENNVTEAPVNKRPKLSPPRIDF